jgi:hypothetical protein
MNRRTRLVEAFVSPDSYGLVLAVAEMIIGQLFLITAVGKVVSVWSPMGRTRDDAPASADGSRSA